MERSVSIRDTRGSGKSFRYFSAPATTQYVSGAVGKMDVRDYLWLGSLVFGAINAWQAKNIVEAILTLKLELVERIARTEGDVKALSVEKD